MSTRSASAATSSASSASRPSSPPTPPAPRAKSRKPATSRARRSRRRSRRKSTACKILKKDVADAKHNTTRFVVLSRKPKWASRTERRVVTTFVFQVRNIPAALYKALGGFATNGVNMTKLESYMVDGSFAATQFYADVQGHPEGPRARTGARGAGVRLAAEDAEDSRRLSGAPFPRHDQVDLGAASQLRTSPVRTSP